MPTTKTAQALADACADTSAAQYKAQQAKCNADQNAQACAERVAQLEARLAGGDMSVTVADISEAQQKAHHAALAAQGHEVAVKKATEADLVAFREQARADVAENAAGELASASDLTAKLDAFDRALRDFCEAVDGHNERLAHWRRRAVDAGGFEIGDFTTLQAPKMVASIVHRVMDAYPREYLRCWGHTTITHWGDPLESRGVPIDLHEMIRKAAGQ
jgi:hypothetical protein